MKTSREDLVKIASAQKILLWAILFGIVVTGGAAVLAVSLQDQPLEPAMFLVVNGAILAARVAAIALQIAAVVRLCLAMKEGWGTALYVIFQFVPCISLILLLFLNGRATKRLQAAGIRVGLMGANSSDLADYQPKDRKCPGCSEPVEDAAICCPMCGAMLPAGAKL